MIPPDNICDWSLRLEIPVGSAIRVVQNSQISDVTVFYKDPNTLRQRINEAKKMGPVNRWMDPVDFGHYKESSIFLVIDKNIASDGRIDVKVLTPEGRLGWLVGYEDDIQPL